MAKTKSFRKAVSARRSIRAFTPEPIDPEVLAEILEEAHRSPSNCNTQPWGVHIVSGAKRDEVSSALCEAMDAERYSMDFSFDPDHYPERFRERRREQGRCFYEALSMGRDDHEGRRLATRKNLTFYGAPHAAFLFMPAVGDGVRVGADIGMFAQTFLLALAARGFGAIPQTILGYFADPVREVLGIGDEMRSCSGSPSARSTRPIPPTRCGWAAIRYRSASPSIPSSKPSAGAETGPRSTWAPTQAVASISPRSTACARRPKSSSF